MLTYEKYFSAEEIMERQKKLQKANIIKKTLLFYPYFLIHYDCKYEFCRWFASQRQAVVLIDGLTGDGTVAKISKKRIDVQLPDGSFSLKPVLSDDNIEKSVKQIAQQITMKMIYHEKEVNIVDKLLVYIPFWCFKTEEVDEKINLYVINALNNQADYKIRDNILKSINLIK